MRSLLRSVAALCLLTLAAAAAEFDALNGRWVLKKTADDGRVFNQTIEIKDGRFTFQITTADDSPVLYATGDLKIEKQGVFPCLRFTAIRAGASKDSLEAIDDDRVCPYRLGSGSLTLVSDLDRERESAPSLDLYKKAAK